MPVLKNSTVRTFNNGGDFNNADFGVFSYANGQHGITNAPYITGDSYGILLVAGAMDSSYDERTQFCYDIAQSALYIRAKWNGTWTSWGKIETVTVTT